MLLRTLKFYKVKAAPQKPGTSSDLVPGWLELTSSGLSGDTGFFQTSENFPNSG